MKIGIVGYGNLGRAVEISARDEEKAEVVGVFTRRNRNDVKTLGAPVFEMAALDGFRELIDVLLICYGSSSDLPELAPEIAGKFNTVDTFDNHKMILEYKERMDRAARNSLHTSVFSLGWDPGLLSLFRLYLSVLLPHSAVNTFWGRGVSQGHSEALKRIPGVINAVEYTVPKEEALTLASLVCHPLDDTDRHRRVCYIYAEKGKEDSVREQVLSMKDYFSGYDTEIHFTEDGILPPSGSMSHRGRIYALGQSGIYREHKHSAYFDLDLGSNPELTAHIALMGAFACRTLNGQGRYGAYTAFDIPPSIFLTAVGKAPYLHL